MLYVTTRSSRDAFTAARTLRDAPPGGGQYVPFRLTPLPQGQIDSLMEQGFAKCCAEILNLFFSTKLTSMDVDFCVGKNLCKTHVMNHRIAVAELWHNQQRDFEWVVTRLFARLQDSVSAFQSPGEWVQLSVRIAALFGAFSELHRSAVLEPGQTIDIAVDADDFSQAIAAWYARYMGLPVGKILFACSAFTGFWDLLNYGQMRADHVPAGLERLICLTLGYDEAARFAQVDASGRPYTLRPDQTELLRKGLFAAVVGPQRIGSIIASVYRTNDYLLEPSSALAYGGIQDFRAQSGEVRPTLILAERNPAVCADAAAQAMGISPAQFKKQFHLD